MKLKARGERTPRLHTDFFRADVPEGKERSSYCNPTNCDVVLTSFLPKTSTTAVKNLTKLINRVKSCAEYDALVLLLLEGLHKL